jgi:DNA-binding NarL/FixJ family response regulator
VTVPIRVAIVDDHPVVREGMAALLAAQPDLEVVGGAGSLEEARTLLAAGGIDVLLLDIRLGDDSGLRLLETVEAGDGRRPAIVVLTAYSYPQYAEAALRLGAAGFVELSHYYRPESVPLDERPWLASVWRRPAGGR